MSVVPRVSVIVPASNAERTVVETVRSALAQTCTDLEGLVLDDGSTDETVARVAAIPDPRLGVGRAAHAGLATARHHGIAATRGARVAFLGADDVWTPDKLARQAAALDAQPAAGAA